ncbi:MMPL family transporter [Schumannella soli]|uniref:MMPL family transporter n=1 Tax=Schumannella soli TaxID=2590779 RepID=A0A506Y8L2_9MICO|nr:MMPL family transporter [Schumannella soli]TPW77527.1 MMPL family transporter [Schumannella soli]
MAELLYRLGVFSARRAKTVILAWIVIVAIVGGGFALGFRGLSSSFDIPGTRSGAVLEQLQKKLPDFSGASGSVVFATDDGSALTAEQQKQISARIADADGLPDVNSVVDPFATEAQRADRQKQVDDGSAQLDAARTQLEQGQAQLDAAKAQLTAAGLPTTALDAKQKELDEGAAELTAQQKQLDDGAHLLELADGIRQVASDGSAAVATVSFTLPRLELPETAKQAVVKHFDAKKIDGVTVSYSTEISQGVPQILGLGEAIGVVIAAIVLIVMLGSLLAASFPIVTAIAGVAIASLGTLAFSGVVQMASVTPVLGVMLGLAVGIDYALFIINRHRRQLLEGAEVRESIGLANGTAGNAVVFAGSTVVVALLALNITGIPFLGLMGTAGAIAVVIAVLIAISLTPALLGLAGTRVLGRRGRRQLAASSERRRADAGVKPMSTLRAVVTAVLAVAALLVIAIPSFSMRLGLPDGGSEPAGSAARVAFDTQAKQFGAGANSALLVTADLPADQDDSEQLDSQLQIAEALAKVDDVAAVAPIAVSDDGRLGAFQVLPDHGPNAVSTEKLVRELRGLDPIGTGDLGVAGQAASNIDISESLGAVLPIYLVVVIGLSLIIMIGVFRSLLVPIIATGGFVLSLLANYGAIVAVFQWGWLSDLFHVTPGPILSFLPVILVGILFGLAMDYQLFLSSGMREAYVHGSPARLAVAQGFRAGRSVVIAAGIIMVAVFSGFIGSESTIIRSLGFGLAFGVLLDAFVVRLLLMPALMHLLGRAAWWFPRWLDRIVPDVDVEGAALERRHHVEAEAMPTAHAAG